MDRLNRRQMVLLGFQSLVVIPLLEACGGGKGNPMEPNSSVVPSSSTPITQDLSGVVVWAVEQFPSGIASNLYGNIRLGMDNSVDPYGSSIRLRVKDAAGKVHTYIADYANSSPIGNTNDTILRDITVADLGGMVNMSLKMQPKGCTSLGCLIPFTFSNQDIVKTIPNNQYHFVNQEGEVWLQGAVPGINQGRSEGIRAMSVNGTQMDRVPLTPWRLEQVE